MKGLRRSKRLRNQDPSDDNSQENKGEALHAPVDNDDEEEEEEDIDVDHARPRTSATKEAFSLPDLSRLALKPGLTAKELANGFWNLQGRLEEIETVPDHNELDDTFVKNIILGRNLEVFLEVDKSLSLGEGMILQLMYAAVRVGDEDAVVQLVSLLHKRRYTNLFGAVEEALRIDLPYEAPHSGFRGVVKEVVRLKIVKPGDKAVTPTYSCRNFIENFNVVWCSKQALIAIDEVLGPQVWNEIRCNRAIAAEIEHHCKFDETMAHSGVLEHLLRHNAVTISLEVCTYISEYLRAPPLYKHSPHILSLIDYYKEAGFPILEAKNDKEDVLDLIRGNVLCFHGREGYGRVDQLHSLLEFCVPAESSCTVREDGLLDEPRPPQHIVEKRAKMVIDAICERGRWYQPMSEQPGLPLQHYLFHELQLDIEEVSKCCNFRVIYLGPTSPPTLVDNVLQNVHANVPTLDIDKWKELFQQDVYPVPIYCGGQDRRGARLSVADKMKIYRKSLRFCHKDANVAYPIMELWTQTHETLEYLRPWFRVFSEALSEETKFSINQAMHVCFASDFRAQAMVEADMIRISDELRDEWRQNIRKIRKVFYLHLFYSLSPIYLKWYEHTKDRELMQMLQVVMFASGCAANRISEAKRVLQGMLQPPSGQDPWVQVSSNRAYLLTMAACTRNLPFVKWVNAQIQAAFPVESSGKLKDLGHVSGPDHTIIEWRNHQLTIPAWLDFMTDLIPITERGRFGDRDSSVPLDNPFAVYTDAILSRPCPKHLMDTGLLLAQTDPLAVLPLIFRIVFMKQQSLLCWARKFGFYDTPKEKHNARDDDNDDDDKDANKGQCGTNSAWAWGPITLVKLIELIADETTDTAHTILSAKEQTEGIGVKGGRAFSLIKSGDGESDSDDDDDDYDGDGWDYYEYHKSTYERDCDHDVASDDDDDDDSDASDNGDD